MTIRWSGRALSSANKMLKRIFSPSSSVSLQSAALKPRIGQTRGALLLEEEEEDGLHENFHTSELQHESHDCKN